MLRSEQKFRPCIPIVTHLYTFEHKSNQLFRFLQYLLFIRKLCLITARALQRYCMGVAVLLHQPCSTPATRVAVGGLRQMG